MNLQPCCGGKEGKGRHGVLEAGPAAGAGCAQIERPVDVHINVIFVRS